jgi:hypothetical protein
MKALFVDGSDFLDKPYDLDRLVVKAGDVTTKTKLNARSAKPLAPRKHFSRLSFGARSS